MGKTLPAILAERDQAGQVVTNLRPDPGEQITEEVTSYGASADGIYHRISSISKLGGTPIIRMIRYRRTVRRCCQARSGWLPICKVHDASRYG
jgi:hypothetical protein